MAAEGEAQNHKFLSVHKDVAFVAMSLSLFALGVRYHRYDTAFVLTSLALIALIVVMHHYKSSFS